MAKPKFIEVCKADLFTDVNELSPKYPPEQVQHILRVREMYVWFIANPSSKDRQFIEEVVSRFQIGTTKAYADLAIVKALLPCLSAASRDFHRYRFNEMILDTYNMARARKDTKTMEKAASSYAKYNRVDIEDEQAVPYDDIVIQPFTATSDPTVLGIKPIPNLQQRIEQLLHKYGADSDIEDVDFEPADLEESTLLTTQENG